MKTGQIQVLTENFEAHAQQTEGGVEYWLARDIQFLLGYAKWDNFLNFVSKAKTACEVSGHNMPDHFADVGKMVDLGSGSQRETDRNSAVHKNSYKNVDKSLDKSVPKGVIIQLSKVHSPHGIKAAQLSRACADPLGLFFCNFLFPSWRREGV